LAISRELITTRQRLMAKYAHLHRPRGLSVKRIKRTADFEYMVRGVVVDQRREVVGRTSDHRFSCADPLLSAEVVLMRHTEVKQSMLVCA
jgi:hypothetical protein